MGGWGVFMAGEQLESVLGHIRKLVAAQTEEPLLDRDEAAFAALVRR